MHYFMYSGQTAHGATQWTSIATLAASFTRYKRNPAIVWKGEQGSGAVVGDGERVAAPLRGQMDKLKKIAPKYRRVENTKICPCDSVVLLLVGSASGLARGFGEIFSGLKIFWWKGRNSLDKILCALWYCWYCLAAGLLGLKMIVTWQQRGNISTHQIL